MLFLQSDAGVNRFMPLWFIYQGRSIKLSTRNLLIFRKGSINCKHVESDFRRCIRKGLLRNIDKKFKEWAPIFTAMLVEKLFETNGMVADCPEVMASSQNYKAQQDYFTGFMKERIVKLESGRIKKTDVLHEFQEWYSELYGGKVPSGKELYDFLEKKLGRPGRTGWKGWNLYHSWDMQDDDDIEPNGI